MLFTTPTYAIFACLVFTIYWLARARRAQNGVLLAAGYIFYGWWDWRFCSLMLFSSAWDFFAGKILSGTSSHARRRLILASSIAVNIALLGFFKYANFFANNFQDLAAFVGWKVSPFFLNVILPVGISFYTFQSIGYVFDVYRKKSGPCTSILDYFAFVAFFPQLMAGPIERAAHLLPQFQRPRSFSRAAAEDGCRQVLWGFFKKVAIADKLAPLVDSIYANPSGHSALSLVIGTIFFAFQIYCDFSGYSDIALGTARLLGFELMRNFAYPYFSQSVGEFWRRWHISLSTWFRDYLFIPLGGSRVSTPRKLLNVLVTFTVSGFWHGAAWQFIAWGALNGIGLMPQMLSKTSTKRTPSDVPGENGLSLSAILKMALTFTFISVAWIFFRASSVTDAGRILFRIFSTSWTAELPSREFLKPALLVSLLIATEWVQRAHLHPLRQLRIALPFRWILYTLLLWGTIDTAPTGVSPFIYFQF